MKALIVDLTRCNGCYNCQLACKDEHVGNDWSPIAKPQPDTGQFWLRLKEHARGVMPRVRVVYQPVMCQHCSEAPCMKACPVDKGIYRRNDGAVVIDAEKCTGCRSCVDLCPYGTIYFNDDLGLAQKCTLCAHLLDRGWKEPRCVDACPTCALIFGEEEELAGRIAETEIFHPEHQTHPLVRYIGLPKPFVAGAVYDPNKDEVAKGAILSLEAESADESAAEPAGESAPEHAGAAYPGMTDAFGEFIIRDVRPGTYTLTITAEGFPVKTLHGIEVEGEVDLGDIAVG